MRKMNGEASRLKREFEQSDVSDCIVPIAFAKRVDNITCALRPIPRQGQRLATHCSIRRDAMLSNTLDMIYSKATQPAEVRCNHI